jgi:lysozyme
VNNLREMLKRHEGVKSHAYRCTAGKITVGVGRNIDSDGGLGLSHDEIDYLLDNDIVRCIQELNGVFPWFNHLDTVRSDAIVDICFNLGLPRLMLFQKAIRAMKEGDYEKAADEFYDSKWAKQVGNRAIEVCEMIRTGRYKK